MRQPGKYPSVDHNQKPIVKALTLMGASVTLLHKVGKGCPDLLVGYRGKTYLLELKVTDGIKNPRPRPLTPAQVEWHQRWKGTPVHVVTTIEEAKRIVTQEGE